MGFKDLQMAGVVSQAENIDENGKKFSSFEKLHVRHNKEQIFFPIKI